MHEVIVTPFGFATTADDVIAGLDLSGKQVIVTGGASGIGLETARALANAGAEVTLAVRNRRRECGAAFGRCAESVVLNAEGKDVC